MAEPEVIPVVDAGGPVEGIPSVVEPIVAHTDTPALLSPTPETAPAPVVEAVIAEPAPAAVEAAAPVVEPVAEVPAEIPAPVVAPEPIRYGALTLPEGVTLEAERIGDFDAIIAPHNLPAEARQHLADMHIAEMQRYAAHVASEQQRVFAETRRGWRNEVMNDPELWRPGLELGNQPHIAAAMRMLDQFVPAGQRKALYEALAATGMGDHPMLLRLLNNVAKKFDAPVTPTAPAGPAPDRGGGRGVGRRLRDLYDNPRSHSG